MGKYVEFEFFPKFWDSGFFFFLGRGGKFGCESERYGFCAVETFCVFNYCFDILFGRVSFFFFLNQKLVFANFKNIKMFSTRYSIVLLVERCKTSKNGNI